MDHRAFLKALSVEERQTLTARSDAVGLTHLAGHWGAIALVGSLIAMSVPGWQVLIAAQGILLVFLFTLLHETVHQTPFGTPLLNTFVGYVCGFLLFLAPVWFRYFHLAHHRYTQDPENDPELSEPKPETRRQYLIHISGLPIWRNQFKTLFRNASGKGDDAYIPSSKRRRVRDEARLMIAAYAMIFAVCAVLGVVEIITIWLLPLLIGQPFLRLYLLAEHGRCPKVANMFQNTRTTFTTWLVRKLAWNMPYHAEHHTYPNVPFHRLPDLHKRAQQHLRETEDGYGRFNRKYVANLRS